MAAVYRVSKDWRCVGQEGEVFHRRSKLLANQQNHWNEPSQVWAVVVARKKPVPEVYKSPDVPGKWGYVGCRSDMYDSAAEAREDAEGEVPEEVIADCYSAKDAKRVCDALNATVKGA